MKDAQSFRLAGTTQILKIPIQHVDGQSVVYWDRIEQAFPGVKQVKNGDVAIPHCIKYFPGVVLDVVLSGATENFNAESLVGTPSVVPTIALSTTLTVGLSDAPVDIQTGHPSEGKPVKGLRVTSALAETPVNDVRAQASLTGSPVPPPTSHSDVKATSKTAPSCKQVVQLVSKQANESGSQIPIQELSANMAHMIRLQEASDTKQEELKRLQNQALEQQEEMKRLQNQTLEQQEEMKQLQNQALEQHEKMRRLQKQALEGQEKISRLQEQVLHHQEEAKQLQIQSQEELRQMRDEVMGQLAVLQSRVQAVLTQTFELHEYPIPRLFIVLPQDPSGWDAVNPFSNKFRLYFLCECGEHTKLANSRTKIPHHIHLAKHEGYEIARPSEFFRQYGAYLVTILKMLKLGITVAGVVMPALSQLISPDVIGQSIHSLKQLQGNIIPTVDQVIEWMDRVSVDEGEAIEDISTSKGKSEEVIEQMEAKEALEGANLRKLSTFLQDKDENKVLGNLYRTVTVEGHVKWVCIDHYRENYQEAQARAFQRALNLVGGLFDENNGLVTVKLRSRALAEQFYAALGRARSVLELDIDLDFECTKSDLEGLENVLKTSSVSILRLDNQRFRTSIGGKLLSRSAQHEALSRIMTLPNMTTIHIILSKESGKLSSLLPKNSSSLHKLSLEMVVGGTGYMEVRILAEMLKTNSTLVTWYLYNNNIGDNGAQALSKSLKANSAPIILDFERNSIEDNGVQALSEALKTNSTLNTLRLWNNSIGDSGAQALSDALKTNSTLTTLDLNYNKIGGNGAHALSGALKANSTLTTVSLTHNSIGDNGAQALSEALKTNSTLTSLDLNKNKIGHNGAQALSMALKINWTLTTIDLRYNSIGDNGAQALSEALKINSTLTTLDLQYNSIGDIGAQALSEALKINRTLTTLDLRYNSIGNIGTQALSEVLKTNQTLTTLDLRYKNNGALEPSWVLQSNKDMIQLALHEAWNVNNDEWPSAAVGPISGQTKI
ncbi:hypothetical protein BGZ99_008727 [Dissophora globulifera]|uniref:RNI-like protein n=1 Tax=Dissophora globulifera TaxID=979702 RepID=A0A9P6UPG8_9FUNG|nr:hypothetical protein BGZ99_008727 [Dissophora globulifera]